jgi:hypothetical protein
MHCTGWLGYHLSTNIICSVYHKKDEQIEGEELISYACNCVLYSCMCAFSGVADKNEWKRMLNYTEYAFWDV